MLVVVGLRVVVVIVVVVGSITTRVSSISGGTCRHLNDDLISSHSSLTDWYNSFSTINRMPLLPMTHDKTLLCSLHYVFHDLVLLLLIAVEMPSLSHPPRLSSSSLL